jgi:uncharacterized membrane protein YkvA (DUF1232 family)
MSPRLRRPPLRPAQGLRALDMLRHLPHFARLYWRLLRDARVPVWPKALLLLGVLYVLSPIDLIADVLPGSGQVDDVVSLIVVSWLFVYLCPPEVVREHVARIGDETR